MEDLRYSVPRVWYRNGRCYELAFRTLINASTSGAVLVHGTGLGKHGRIGHAWLERDGLAYDIVSDQIMQTSELYASFNVKIEARLSRQEAMRAFVAAGHYGPWPSGQHEGCALEGMD